MVKAMKSSVSQVFFLLCLRLASWKIVEAGIIKKDNIMLQEENTNEGLSVSVGLP